MEQPNIKPIRESGDLYQLVEPYYIDLRPFNVNKRFTIAAGFEYDGATVPRWFWSLSGISRDGIHRAAALVHDYLYSVKGFQGQPHRGNEITRDARKDLTMMTEKTYSPRLLTGFA